jgi:hypothetical protein
MDIISQEADRENRGAFFNSLKTRARDDIPHAYRFVTGARYKEAMVLRKCN